jgi:hypothetical protein
MKMKNRRFEISSVGSVHIVVFVLSQQVLLVDSRQWAREFLFFTVLRPVQVPNHPPSQWLSAFFPPVKEPEV